MLWERCLERFEGGGRREEMGRDPTAHARRNVRGKGRGSEGEGEGIGMEVCVCVTSRDTQAPVPLPKNGPQPHLFVVRAGKEQESSNC